MALMQGCVTPGTPMYWIFACVSWMSLFAENIVVK